jgi:hypothetical protein
MIKGVNIMSFRFENLQRSGVAFFGALFFTAALIAASAPTVVIA